MAMSKKVRELCGLPQAKIHDSIVERSMGMLQALARKDALPPKSHIGYNVALLYLACKEEQASRTDLEFARSFASQSRKSEAELRKDIIKYAEKIRKDLEGEVR